MPWWQFLLAWFVLALIVAPIAGLYLRRLSRHYPKPPPPNPPA